jgi:hypothetical protein
MAQVDVIRNGIIDRLLAISDKDYLMAFWDNRQDPKKLLKAIS